MTDAPARPDMHVRSGSVAIACVATVMLQLVDEGTARLDDPIARRLPDFAHARQITPRTSPPGSPPRGPPTTRCR